MVGTDHAMRHSAPVPVCRACALKPKCCPNMPARRVVRDVNEDARDVARTLAKTEAFEQSCLDCCGRDGCGVRHHTTLISRRKTGRMWRVLGSDQKHQQTRYGAW
jgi:hypothetical protein